LTPLPRQPGATLAPGVLPKISNASFIRPSHRLTPPGNRRAILSGGPLNGFRFDRSTHSTAASVIIAKTLIFTAP